MAGSVAAVSESGRIEWIPFGGNPQLRTRFRARLAAAARQVGVAGSLEVGTPASATRSRPTNDFWFFSIRSRKLVSGAWAGGRRRSWFGGKGSAPRGRLDRSFISG